MANPASRALSAARGGPLRIPTSHKLKPSAATASLSTSTTTATATPVRFVSSRSAITSMSLPSLPSTPVSTSPMSVSRMSIASVGSMNSLASMHRRASNASKRSISPPLSPLLRRRLATASETSVDNQRLYVAPSPPSPPVTPVPVLGAAPVRAVLQDTARMLAEDVGGSSEWYRRVLAAEADLDVTARRRLAVIGDSLAAPHDVVSAVLQDPLADSETMRRALLDRYYGTGTGTLRIEYAEPPSRTDGKLETPSGWLQATKCDVIEVEAAAPKEAVASTLLSADAVCVVLDPIRLTEAPVVQAVLPLVLAKGTVEFVVNGPLPPHVSEATLRAALDKQVKAVVCPGLHGDKSYNVTFVRAEVALRALDALAAALSGTTPKGPAIEAFQRNFVASNVSALSGALSQFPPDHQLVTAATTAHLALAYVDSVIGADRGVLSKTRDVVTALQREAADGTGKARRLSLVARGIAGGVVEGSVDASVDASARDLRHLFASRFSWLGLLARLRVDDVGAELAAYLNRSFARDMETQLVFEAGELAQLQSALGDSANSTARTLQRPARGSGDNKTGHPFSSPVLLNHLESLALSIPPVTPTTLLPPVTTRRAQLLSAAVPRLQRAAQRALLTTYSLAFAGISASWCAAVPPLSLLSSSTALATGSLALVGALALGQALWAKAQARWWRDWARVTDMLKDDLAANYDRTVEALVLARPTVAADGLKALVARREERLEALQTKVKALHARIVQSGRVDE